MDNFIGVKLVEGKPMTLGEYNVFRGWDLPDDEDGNDKGFLFKYRDGYVSWCPEKQFKDQNLAYFGKDNKVSQDDVDAIISGCHVSTITPEGSRSKTTIVICTLANGFTITESSACVDPANYSEEIGSEICMKKIKDKIWFLLGFLLQSAVYGFNERSPELTEMAEACEKDIEKMRVPSPVVPERELRHVALAVMNMRSPLKHFIAVRSPYDEKGVSPEVCFTIQSDPISMVGVNGCQGEDIIEYAKCLIESFNAKFPCRENALTITKLEEALSWQKVRTENRIKAGVEGFNQAIKE